MAHPHSVVDTGARFVIDSHSREIKSESPKKITVVQYDHKSERFTFVLPRYIEEHDMSECDKVEVHYLNAGASPNERVTGLYVVDDLKIDPDDEEKVVCSWLIDSNATQHAGQLSFLLRFCCMTDAVVEYAWNTAIYSNVYVTAGMNASETIVLDYIDVLERWKASLFAAGYINADNMQQDIANLTSDLATERGRIDLLSNYVTPQMFGAKGDGITDDTEAIQKAFAYNEVYIPDGIYIVSAPLIMDDTTHLYGGANAVIKATAAMECVLKNEESVSFENQSFSVKNIVLDGNRLANKGLYLYKISMEHYAAVDGLKIKNCTSEGVYLHLCQTSAFYNIRVTDCANGVLIEGCNNAKFYNLSACSNDGYGVKVNAVTGGSGGVSIFGIHAEQNGGDGLILNNVNSMASVCGGWIEENGGHGLRINNSMACVTGLTVTGTGKNNNRWLYLVGDLATVENCFRAKAAGDASWLDAYIEGNSIVGNINNFQGIEANTLAAREGFSNMLVNGNGESTGGWLGSSTTLTPQSTEKVHSGNSSLKAVSSASGASTHQVITGLNVGSIYHFVGFVYSADVPRLRVYFKYANNADAATNRFYYDIPDEDWAIGSWVPIDFYFRAKDTSYDVHVQSVGSGGVYYMDDFAVKEYVPEAKSTQKIGNANSYVYQIPVLADY